MLVIHRRGPRLVPALGEARGRAVRRAAPAAGGRTPSGPSGRGGRVPLSVSCRALGLAGGVGRPAYWAKSQRVAPWGSAPATPMAVCSVRRNRCQGGGPALGALYGAVSASPSTSAGQPPMR